MTRGTIRVEVWCAPRPAAGRLDRVVEALRVAVGLCLQRNPVELALYGPAVSICAPVDLGHDEHTGAVHRHLSGLRAAGCRVYLEAAAVAEAGLDRSTLLHAPALLSRADLEARRTAARHVLAFGRNPGQELFALASARLAPDASLERVASAVLDVLTPRAGDRGTREVAEPSEAVDHGRHPAMAAVAQISQTSQVSRSSHKSLTTELDLRDETCPYTFVRSKLALEELPEGAELRILLGNGDSARNVPRSCQAEGHEVLRVEQVSPQRWDVLVRRGASRPIGFEEGWVP